MPETHDTAAMIRHLETARDLPTELLGKLLALEDRYPDLNARGERRALYREVSELMDAAADGAAK